MSKSRRRLSLAPAGLIVERFEIAPDRLTVHARPSSESGSCPRCRSPSRSVHSNYARTLHDLPAQGRRVVILVTARRFRCRQSDCPCQIFVERLEGIVEAAHARRTSRFDIVAHQFGLALGGRPAERLIGRLAMPLCADTLIRLVRRRSRSVLTSPRIVGIDDWAWRRGHRYGSIICDLERRAIIDLLPDREMETAVTWLQRHPGIASRDRGGGYAEAAKRALPNAIQVADRWHLFANASAAFKDAVRRLMPEIRRAFGSKDIDPGLLTCAEKLQWDGWRRRKEINDAVVTLSREGMTIKAIARETGIARQTIRRILRGSRDDIFRVRSSSLDPWTERLDAEWSSGCRNGSELWRRLRAAGFHGSARVVSEWTTRRRRDELAGAVPRKSPSPSVIARCLTTNRDTGSAHAAMIVATVEGCVPKIAAARELLDRFHAMMRARRPEDFDEWIAEGKASVIASFANGVAADYAAIRAAITQPWSNGQVEGQVTKLKLVKRQMYGRANLDLLRARLVAT